MPQLGNLVYDSPFFEVGRTDIQENLRASATAWIWDKDPDPAYYASPLKDIQAAKKAFWERHGKPANALFMDRFTAIILVNTTDYNERLSYNPAGDVVFCVNDGLEQKIAPIIMGMEVIIDSIPLYRRDS